MYTVAKIAADTQACMMVILYMSFFFVKYVFGPYKYTNIFVLVPIKFSITTFDPYF